MARRLRKLTARTVAAYVSKNKVPIHTLGELIDLVAAAFAQAPNRLKPSSLSRKADIEVRGARDGILCLLCNRRFLKLKRHLRQTHSITPEAYLERFRLDDNAPMVAEVTAARHAKHAKDAEPWKLAAQRNTGKKRTRKLPD